MQYLGGKSRMARQLARFIAETGAGRSTYIEPFVGGGSVFMEASMAFPITVAADAHPDLIELWRAVAGGWRAPSSLTEVEWQALRHAEPSALRAFAGFGCSFSGKWFGGYARNQRGVADSGLADRAARGVERRRPALERAAAILCCDYAALTPLMGPDVVAYCDPPYAGTTPYGGVGAWDPDRFWSTAAGWRTAGAIVLVSEYTAPPGWRTAAWLDRRMNMRSASGTYETVFELVVT